jgi:glycosyltransferase involved in cell wall biosynthesis
MQSPTGSGKSWPSVTAIIPTRNRPALLRRAVDAVVAQDYPGPIECIVVFDQQRPCELAPTLGPRRTLRTCENTRTPGLAGARNSGAQIAGGELLAFCDDDDVWLPQKIRLQVQELRRHPDASAATCGINVVTNGRRVPRLPPREIVTLDDLTRSRRMEVHSSTLVMRRDRFLGDIGPIDEQIPGSYGEDYDWILRAASRGAIVAVRQPLVDVHWTGSYFSDRWAMIVPALQYQLTKHPELWRDRRNLARIFGRIAFAHAASGAAREARSWARRSMRLDPRQPRGYLAYLVSWGLPADLVQRLVNSMGRGV